MSYAWSAYARGDQPDEDAVTAVFVDRLADTIGGIVGAHGYRFHARALTHRRSGEEKALGADFGVKLQIDTADQRSCYGWIAQAKLHDRVRWIGTTSNPGLREQCGVMLQLTSASFAFVYGPTTDVYGANDVAGLKRAESHRRLVSRGVRHHFRDFFSGAFGDERVCERVFNSNVVQDRRRRNLREPGQSLPAGAVLALYFGRQASEGYQAWSQGISETLDLF
jgi:hypothetical protein